MLYCPDCKAQFEESEKACPVCGTKKIRPIQANDPVFLIYQCGEWAGVVEEVLQDNGIPFIKRDCNGIAALTYLGFNTEKNDYFVPFCEFQKAAELMRELFAPDNIVEE